MPLNPCELEIDLFCHGLRIPSSVSIEGGRGIAAMRAGLGSGLELKIPTDSWIKPAIWMNAPVLESFVAASPFVLEGSRDEGYYVADVRDDGRYPIEIPVRPGWYDRTTARGVPMGRIGTLQGTYLGIYVSPVCAFWTRTPAVNCQFCTTGRNVGSAEVAHKTIADVVETCRAAKDESGITFVHLNGGFQGSGGFDRIAPYVEAIKEQVGLLVGVQLAPERDMHNYDRAISAGADHLSFCLEFYDPFWFREICPGKAEVLGQRLFLDSIKYCASRMPRGAISGEIIAGLEPIATTLRAIDHIALMGAFPTVCIFRPTLGSAMADWPPPDAEDMRTVMRAVYDACRRCRIPIGAAPNIEVSLVVTPDDAAFLSMRTPSFYKYEAWRRMVRLLARPAFRARMRRRAVNPHPRTRGRNVEDQRWTNVH
jgi:hypothetical protein